MTALATAAAPRTQPEAPVWPVESRTISSGFGPRGSGFHHGLDIDAKMGDPVYAAVSGKVVEAGHGDPIHGVYVVIRDALRREWLYAHLSAESVTEGTYILRNAQIGKVGNTGRVFPGPGGDGSHLHVGLKVGGDWVDPLPVLRGATSPTPGPPPATSDPGGSPPASGDQPSGAQVTPASLGQGTVENIGLRLVGLALALAAVLGGFWLMFKEPGRA